MNWQDEIIEKDNTELSIIFKNIKTMKTNEKINEITKRALAGESTLALADELQDQIRKISKDEHPECFSSQMGYTMAHSSFAVMCLLDKLVMINNEINR